MRGLRRQPVAKDPRGSQCPDSHDDRRLPPFWQYVRKLTRSPSRLVSCVTKRVEDIMPALQATYHARERELQCIATEVVEEPGSSPDLLMVQDFTEQCALATSDDKLRVLLAGQPQIFSLIFTISEVPPFALLRSRSKVKDANIHTRQEVVLCQWLHLFDVAATGLLMRSILTFMVVQHSPRHSESCASCPLLWQILRHLLVSPATGLCAHDSRFLSLSICQRASILLHQCCK